MVWPRSFGFGGGASPALRWPLITRGLSNTQLRVQFTTNTIATTIATLRQSERPLRTRRPYSRPRLILRGSGVTAYGEEDPDGAGNGAYVEPDWPTDG